MLMGVAGGGIGLATGNLGMKLAPRDRATSYLAAIGLVGAVAGGVAPLIGGALAQWFSERQLSVLVRWVSPTNLRDLSVLHFSHWECLFVLSALLGLYVLHAVSLIREGPEISERRVIQELELEALRTVNQVSSIGGVVGSIFPFGRLTDRRRTPRPDSVSGDRRRRSTAEPRSGAAQVERRSPQAALTARALKACAAAPARGRATGA